MRLIGYKWKGDDTVTLTTDLSEIKEQIRRARFVVGHNIHSFDLPAIFGVKSNEPLELAMAGRVFDTWTHAVLVNPAPYQYVNRKGKKALADTPSKMRSWFSLDEQAYQLGVPGKTHDLRELAWEFGKAAHPDLPKAAQIDAGYGLIPVDEPRYRDYLVGDVRASEAVAQALLQLGPLDAYARREQEIESRKFVIRSNGWRVDIEKATARRDELAARKEAVLKELQENYGMPTEGKSPWTSKVGKMAIFAALASNGITERNCPNWPRTATGNLSLGGEALIELTKGTEAEELGQALAELKGQRALSQLALDSVYPDGFVHPEITMLQRSGRWSTTEPGLTVWTNNGPGAIEKDYFIPDNEDEVIVEFDFSNADARIVAAVSGDERYAERFEPGADGHMINALAAWGEEVVATDPKGYRQKAKVPGHGWGYRIGSKTLARQTGMDVEESKLFLTNMNKAFPGVVAWQDAACKEAMMTCHVVNDWGRRMRVERGREYTQAPALIGQSGTREIVCDALLGMDIPTLRRVKGQIHDALVFSIPRAQVDSWVRKITGYMETKFKPKHGGQEIDFPVSHGPAGNSWYRAIH